MSAYYNENDHYAAQWLRNLIKADQIAFGVVDERSIVDVRPDDLRGFTQCHFFAGIGGWSVALRQAGWSDDRPVWTGSCPCQPFSAAGKGKAGDDERHLWPSWFSLIRELRPRTVFGEQVEAAVGWGWLDLVFNDLEAEGYACGAAVLPACGIGAPHIRQRLWFVADTECGTAERHGHNLAAAPEGMQGTARQQRIRSDIGDGESVGVGELADSDSWQEEQQSHRAGRGWTGYSRGGGVGHASESGLPPRKCAQLPGAKQLNQGRATEQPSRSPWSDLEWLPCTDGKARPVEPGTFPLAHGVQRRASKLRAYGNAIVPQVAAEFIIASMEDK